MNRSLKYNINLSIENLKSIFSYFEMDENNTIIMLVTRNEKIEENIKEYKDNIIDIKKEGKEYKILLKNFKFAKLYYFLSKNVVFNIYYYKVNKSKDINSSSVCIHVELHKIKEIKFDDKVYNYEKVSNDLIKYKSIHIEYIIILIIILIGILIRIRG